MLSTFHGDDMIDKRRRMRKADGGVEVIKKPLMVDDGRCGQKRSVDTLLWIPTSVYNYVI